MIIAPTSAGSRLAQGKKKESHQAAARHKTTDEETGLTVNGHGTKRQPKKEYW